MVRARKPNRTDLTGDSRSQEPITVAPGQPYGEATAQRNAQREVPIGSTPMPTPNVAPTASPAQPQPGPGELPFLEPTQRPNEPVTAGMASGPGPGPAPAPVAPRLSQSMLDAAMRGGSDTLANMALGLHSVGL